VAKARKGVKGERGGQVSRIRKREEGESVDGAMGWTGLDWAGGRTKSEKKRKRERLEDGQRRTASCDRLCCLLSIDSADQSRTNMSVSQCIGFLLAHDTVHKSIYPPCSSSFCPVANCKPIRPSLLAPSLHFFVFCSTFCVLAAVCSGGIYYRRADLWSGH